MSLDLNLASRPFRNRRLPRLAAAALALAALLLTALHALMLSRLHAAPARQRQAEVAALEAELRDLRAAHSRLALPEVSRATAARWDAVREVVDRRAFSWTLLLSRLEAALPRDVRLVSVAPTAADGRLFVQVSAEAETIEAGFALVARLEQCPEFADVRPSSIADGDQGRVEMQYRLRYLPEAVPVGGPSASSAPDASPAAAASPESRS